MPNNIDRASQFIPFDALKGFKEALKIVERNIERKKELSEDLFEDINTKLKLLKKGDKVNIKYYYQVEYIDTVDRINKIDYKVRKIYLFNSIIDFDDIFSIELLN